MKYLHFVLLILPAFAFAWPPVDVPAGKYVHHFAAVSRRLNEGITEEVRFMVNLPYRMEDDSGVYWTRHPLIPTPYHQPVPHRAPFAVHVLRLHNGRPIMGWVAHMKNYLFEYFTMADGRTRFSLRIQTDDDVPARLEPGETQKRAIRNFHIVLDEEGRWGFSQRMGMSPFDGGTWTTFDEVLGVRNIFAELETARPRMRSVAATLRAVTGETMLWTDSSPPPLTTETCRSRLQLAGIPGMDSSWMFKDD